MNFKKVRRVCDVTGEPIDFVKEDTDVACGAVMILNTSYGEPADTIQCNAGTDRIVLSKKVLKKTLEFWRTLEEYEPEPIVSILEKRYKIKDKK